VNALFVRDLIIVGIMKQITGRPEDAAFSFSFLYEVVRTTVSFGPTCHAQVLTSTEIQSVTSTCSICTSLSAS
jgi:hypothetical protein